MSDKASALLKLIEAARTPAPRVGNPFEGSFKNTQTEALDKLIEVISTTDAILYLHVKEEA